MVPYPFYNPNQPVGMNSQDSTSDPRGYGVTNQMPQSMNPQPSSLPVTYQDRQSLFGMTPSYAEGGQVSPLAQYIQSMGQRNDSVLAHISPQEAMELEQRHGGDINPHTGLPQYGKFDIIKVVKHGIPVAASILGYMYGGPMGAVAAGALTRGAIGAGNHDNPLKGAGRGALEGAGIGAATSVGAPLFAKGLGALGGLKGAGALSGKGAASAIGSAAGKRAAAMEGLKAIGSSYQPTGIKGLMGALGDKVSSAWAGSSLLDKGLLGTAIAGTLLGKNSEAKPMPTYQENQTVLQDPGWRQDQMPSGGFTPFSRAINGGNFDPYQAGLVPEHSYFGNFAEGGSVAHYYQGGAGGQDDNLDAYVKAGDFIWDSDAVAGLGDGNPIAGGNKLIEEADRIIGPSKRPLFSSLSLDMKPNARLSPTEVKWDKSVVDKIGGGNNARGAKIIEGARERLRAHKRSAPTNKIPPKAKSISEYMLGGKY